MADFLAPILHRVKHLSRFCTANQVIENVRENVETVLNSRLSIPGDYTLRPTDERSQARLDRSLVNFGVTDFQSLNMGDPEMEKRFCESIRQAILRYEPRLDQVQVQMVPSVSDRLISVQVQGRLVVQPFDEIRLETGLDVMVQRFKVDT